ncbi:penicillin acylase family protein [Ramlibacter sp. PS4R-6]|uniref:penicillin acylase family protein n=1 Tax=Ramlibacter sp. PS4R-6 TaxID=3133438 RepID=UPI00309F5399
MRVAKGILGALLVIVLFAAVAGGVYVWQAFPDLDGRIDAPGLVDPVYVRRDTADVTHIEARSLADAYYAMGFVHAQERGWQLEFNRRVMHGELSEVFGPATLDTDRLLRRLGIMRAAQKQWEGLKPQEKDLIAAYAKGVNAFHRTSMQALPPEFHILRVMPGEWTPQDTVAWVLMMALDLGGNWGTEFARLSALQAVDTQQLWQVMPPYPGEQPPTKVDLAALYRGLGVYRTDGNGAKKTVQSFNDIDLWREGLGHLEGVGSNNWVVSGTRTQSGKPLLANDPHLGLTSPAIWYFAHIKVPAAGSQKAMDVIGATFPGAPSVVLGRTDGVAWAFTNTGPDVQDLYLEQVDPADPKRYRTPTGFAPFEVREETIRVKGQPDEKLVIRSTRHGPVISDGNATYADVIDTARYAIALRWSALDADNRTVTSILQANLAQDTDEIVAAFSSFHSPMQNLVAADTKGKTVFRTIGVIPQRAADNDIRGIAPSPGWEARYDWTGWVPAAQVPNIGSDAIAAKGWHATANQRIHPADFPVYMGSDWVSPERFDRIETLLAAKPKHDAQSMRDVHADTLSLATQRLLPMLRATQGTHAKAAEAQALLKDFDGTMRADGAAPLVFAYWADELTRAVIAPKLGEAKFNALYGKRTFRAGLEQIAGDPKAAAAWCGAATCAQQSAKALDRALERIVAEQGSDAAKWRWGRAHPALSGHRPFTNVGALAKFFDVQVESPGDPWTVNVAQYWVNQQRLPFASRHAPSMRAIYDLADLEKSQFIYQTGQSGLVFSSRYRDMANEWAQVKYRPLQMRPASWAHQSTLTPMWEAASAAEHSPAR